MKKFYSFLIAFVVLTGSALYADNDKPISIDKLPVAAREFIAKNFPNEKVALAKVDNEIIEVSYEVFFVSSIKIEFYRNGDWKEVDCEFSKVPDSVIPQAIKSKITELYPNAFVVKIEKDKYGCDLKLNNGVELEFDKKNNLVDIDD